MRGIRIGRILGIPIYLHSSWFIVFALITFSLVQQFNSQHPQWSQTQHWLVGVLTSLLFFGSVLFHELAHSVVALRFKIRVVSITLFIFGGIARIGREARTAAQEFLIAVAGPVSSYLLATPASVSLFLDHIATLGRAPVIQLPAEIVQNRFRLSRMKVTGP